MFELMLLFLLFRCFVVFVFVFRYTMLQRLALQCLRALTAMPARSRLTAGTRRCVLEWSCWIRLYRLSLVLRVIVVRFGGVYARYIC